MTSIYDNVEDLLAATDPLLPVYCIYPHVYRESTKHFLNGFPGRVLSAPGLSAITRVLLRKTDSVYLNDGMYGAFWELRFKGHLGYPCRAYRNGFYSEQAVSIANDKTLPPK